MSRLGRQPISVSDKVKVSVAGSRVDVEGPLGKLSRELPFGLQAQLKDKALLVTRADDSTRQKSLHGTWRKVLLNMVEGVEKGFSKELKIEGVGFRAQTAANKVTMTMGFSHPVEYAIPAGIKITIDAKQTGIVVQGANKETVEACKFVNEALHLRAKYLFAPAKPVHHDSSGVPSPAQSTLFTIYFHL